MVQINLSVAFILAAAAIAPIVAVPVNVVDPVQTKKAEVDPKPEATKAGSNVAHVAVPQQHKLAEAEVVPKPDSEATTGKAGSNAAHVAVPQQHKLAEAKVEPKPDSEATTGKAGSNAVAHKPHSLVGGHLKQLESASQGTKNLKKHRTGNHKARKHHHKQGRNHHRKGRNLGKARNLEKVRNLEKARNPEEKARNLEKGQNLEKGGNLEKGSPRADREASLTPHKADKTEVQETPSLKESTGKNRLSARDDSAEMFERSFDDIDLATELAARDDPQMFERSFVDFDYEA